MKHPKHEGAAAAAAAGVDEDLISLLMNDPVLHCRRLLRPTETEGKLCRRMLESLSHLICKAMGQETGEQATN